MYAVILITAPERQEAEKIAQVLVEEKLAACVNIIADIHSIFWWEGKIDNSKETLLIIKTKKSRVKKLIKKVQSIHSYEVPEIITLPVIAGNKKYLNWIDESTR
ncbi:MAG: divalent-cation tolerance protein CutA [Candidatus Omnitrophota bacterium]|nr:MAG: divalent-cation tolerance protein CutA [Candidatus Omnitrophota bacterium]